MLRVTRLATVSGRLGGWELGRLGASGILRAAQGWVQILSCALFGEFNVFEIAKSSSSKEVCRQKRHFSAVHKEDSRLV